MKTVTFSSFIDSGTKTGLATTGTDADVDAVLTFPSSISLQFHIYIFYMLFIKIKFINNYIHT